MLVTCGSRRVAGTSAGETTIAAWVLSEILLVIIFRIIKIGQGFDFSGNAGIALLPQCPLVGRPAALGLFELRGGAGIDRGAVLGATVVSLAHTLSRVVGFPKRGEQVLEQYDLGVEEHQHYLGMSRATRADILIAWVSSYTPGVTRRRAVHALEFPEQSLGTPETTQTKYGAVQMLRYWCNESIARHEVFGRRTDRLFPIG